MPIGPDVRFGSKADMCSAKRKFVIALLLCLIGIGIFVLIYMLVVKPRFCQRCSDRQ
jgi:ABC-type lipoprotein release transport system permease subunit